MSAARRVISACPARVLIPLRAPVLLLMPSVASLFVLLTILAWVLHLCHHQSAHLYRDLLSELIPVRGNKVAQDPDT